MKYFYYQRFLLTLIGIFLLHLVPGISVAQCLLEPVSLSRRATEADVIVEGRVLSRESFWKPDSSGIYTSHLIGIYKVLKGNTVLSEVELITPGGIVGMDMEVVNPSLHLRWVYFFCGVKPVSGRVLSRRVEERFIVLIQVFRDSFAMMKLLERPAMCSMNTTMFKENYWIRYSGTPARLLYQYLHTNFPNLPKQVHALHQSSITFCHRPFQQVPTVS